MTLLNQTSLTDLRAVEPVPVSSDVATEKPIYVIMAGGGTGGHIYPGLAVVEKLNQQLGNKGGDVKIIWAATPRKIDRQLLGGDEKNYIPQAIKPLSKNPLRWWAFYRAWISTCRYWRGYFSEHQVAAVLALGGYAAGAVAYEAARLHIPVGLVNPDAMVGRANRFLMSRASMIFMQWPMKQFNGAAGRRYVERTQVVGCPIRGAMVRINRLEAANRLGLATDRKTLLITGASLGSQSINKAVATLLADREIQQLLNGAGNSRWQILHLAGLEHGAELRDTASRTPGIPWKVLDYCDDMAAAMAMADLAIARAGAGTCAELACMGVPAILMPYPFHKDRHQEANAENLCSAGAAVLVHDRKDARSNAAALKPVLMRLISETDRLTEMAMASQSEAKPGAATAIAQWLMEQIHKQNGVVK